MAFDPDAYLAQKPAAPPVAFDPDAYLQATAANIPGPRRTGARADQIPGYGGPVPAPTATPAPTTPASFTERLLAPLETGVALATGAITAPVVEAAKIYGALTSGKYGTQAGIQVGEATGRKVQQFFQPALSPTAQAQTEAIGNALASTGIQGVPLNVLGDLGRATSTARRAALLVTAPIEARQQRVQQQRVAQSYANAPMIDAVQSAQRIGAAVPPAISNPTLGNVIKGKLAEPELKQRLARDNEAAVTNAVRKDLGVKPTERLVPEVDEVTGKLNPNNPISRALDEASAPYEPIRKMEALTAPKKSIDALAALKQQAPIGGETKTAAINSLVDDAIEKLQKTTTGAFSGVGGGPVAVGRSGAAVLDDIRSLRRDAQVTYRAQKVNPDPLAIAKADTQMAIASILEDVIDANATSPQMLSDLKKARTRVAQIYDHERSINYGMQKVDPQAYVKLLEERKGSMTGVGADIAKSAAMFPDYFTLTPVQVKGLPRVTRGGAGAAIGGALLAPFGPAAALAGTAAGMTIGATAGARSAKQIASPAYQRANALPPDYRPVPMGTTPGEVRYGPNALVPYDYSQQAFTPPNFVMMGEQYGPQVNLVSDLTRALPAPSAEATMANLEAIRQGRYRSDVIRAQTAEAQQAAAEAAARRPARGGENLVFDAAGNLVPEATVTQANIVGAPTALSSAVQKLSGQVIEQPSTSYRTMTIAPKTGAQPYTRIIKKEGETTFERGVSRAFDLTAEERIAWNKAKADLAEVVPGMKALSDEAVAARIADRNWTDKAVANAREKAVALARRDALLTEQLANRNNLRLLARDIEAKQKELAKIKEDRARMMDLADMLDENMRAPRPDTSRKQQGRKTLEAKRNALAPDKTNNLAP